MSDIDQILKGIDQCETDSPDGWWETSAGAEFGARKLAEIKGALSARSTLTTLAQSKVEQMGGKVVGVLVENEAGALAAVHDLGRVVWLDDAAPKSVGDPRLESLTHEKCGGKVKGRHVDGDPVICLKCGAGGVVIVDDGGIDITWVTPPEEGAE